MLDEQTGVYFRAEAVGLDRRTNVWLARCPEPNCHFRASSPEESRVQARFDNHTCPQESGTSHYGVSVTISLIEECWSKADLLYAKLQDMDDKSSDAANQVRYELRGMCKIMSVFVSPFFKTFQEVATELAKRYNLREANQHYETPGTQTRIFDIPKPVTEQESVAARAAKMLDQEEREGIKMAFDSGKFKVEQLAKMYDVTTAVIREVCS